MTNQTLSPSISIECPSCGKHTIVEQPSGVFQCIACDFKRDLSRMDSRSGSGGRSKKKSQKRRGGQSDDDQTPLPLLLAAGIFLLLLI